MIIKPMVEKISILILMVLFSTPYAKAANGFNTFEWMQGRIANPDELSSLFGCTEVPEVTGFATSSKNLSLSTQGQWIPAGLNVTKDKMIKFDWNTSNLEAKPRKYLVMYRIDPRFSRPQLFIQTWNDSQNKYISDFHQFLNGQLVRYQDNPDMTFSQRVLDYNSYFYFSARPAIPVYKDDVVNITLTDSGDFFANSDQFLYELNNSMNETKIIYTVSGGLNNKVVFATSASWCNMLSYTQPYLFSSYCNAGKYKNQNDLVNILLGNESLVALNSIPSCPSMSNTPNLYPLCSYDKGRGMRITVSGKQIKSEAETFIHSDFTNKDFLYYQADASGILDINTSWNMANMFSNTVIGTFSQYMSDWPSGNILTRLFPSPTFIPGYWSGWTYYPPLIISNTASANFLHFGRYIMIVEIGNGNQIVNTEQQQAIKVEYVITDGSTPSSGVSGTQIEQNAMVDANDSGSLWLRVINPNLNVQGLVTVNSSTYTGSTWFSDIVYNKIITPLQAQFNSLTKQFYTKLVTNPTLQRIAKLMLTLYICIYGLFFLAGSIKITIMDIVIRVVKIALIAALFSKQSWDFFNNNLFQIFVSGSDYLLRSTTALTSSTANIFGFVDPIFDKYTNNRVWELLFIQLLQIHNGLTVFAIITIYSILTYFRAVLEVVVNYCLAFVGTAVMIALAPFFLTFMLFEQTKSLFTNWLSTLFNYMIQPTVVLVFFLLIEQMMAEQILKAVTRACWGILIPIEFGLNLRHIGVPIEFSFKLPFLPGIPFYISQVSEPQNLEGIYNQVGTFMAVATSSLLFYAYSLMASGLIDYVTQVAAQLTNVTPARKEGERQYAANPTESVMQDMSKVGSAVTSPIRSAGGVFKDKVINQNYRRREDGNADLNESKGYANKLSEGSRHDEPSEKGKS